MGLSEYMINEEAFDYSSFIDILVKEKVKDLNELLIKDIKNR